MKAPKEPKTKPEAQETSEPEECELSDEELDAVAGGGDPSERDDD